MAGRRELHKRQVRERVVDTAMDLFAERGYDGVTIEEIADAADIAPRTFYRYFPTKESLLYHDADEQLDVLRVAIRDAPEHDSPIRTLQNAITTLAQHTLPIRARQYQTAQLATESSSLDGYQRTVLQPLTEQVIIDAFAARLHVDPEIDPRPQLLAMLGIVLMNTTRRAWLQSQGTIDIEATIAQRAATLAELVAPQNRDLRH